MALGMGMGACIDVMPTRERGPDRAGAVDGGAYRDAERDCCRIPAPRRSLVLQEILGLLLTVPNESSQL